MLAAGAGTLPRGHFLFEPYLYDVIQYGSFDRKGIGSATPHSNGFGSLTYILYGLTDRFTAGVIPTAGFNTVSNGPSSSRIGVGDVSLVTQYRLAQYHKGSWIPTASINVQESLPTGQYDRLGDRPTDGFGNGDYATEVSLYTQTYFWMPNGRILRARLNASQTFSGKAFINGVSVYGTSPGFRGYAHPGNSFSLDIAQEYSVTENWVLAMDEYYRHGANTTVTGNNSVMNLGTNDTYALAPAVEYNWTPNVGVLLGVRLIPAGHNSSITITPVAAINIVR